jgi:hypothetical protein
MQTVECNELDAKVLALLEPGESAVFAARPAYATVRAGQHWNAPALVLTDRRLLISKDRLFGKAKADFAAAWTEVSRVEGSLWNGGGPQIQLLVFNSRTVEPVELIVAPQHAVDVESAIRSGYLNASQ